MTTEERNKTSAGSINMIPAKKLRPHPLNPRKRLGDLTELTDSIKKNGILQNLTVVPDPDKDDGYLIIIGHRRFAAGKKAGLTEFPCAIRTLEEADQVKIMLCENIQRNDLTVVEQAAGFQMMIDYGVTVQELSDQTGFAQSTIYHRLNIAKLDQKALKKKLPEITITDLVEMEKIEDVDVRNDILKSADRSNIRQKIERAYADQEAVKRIKLLVKKCEDAGLERKDTNRWTGDIIIVAQCYAYDKTDIEKFDISDAEYYSMNGQLSIFAYRSKDGAAGQKDPKQEAYDKERTRLEGEVGEQIDKIRDAANQIYQEICAFGVVVKEGKYDRDGASTFMPTALRFFATSSYSPFNNTSEEFDPETYDICSKWSYKGSTAEWMEEMHQQIANAVGDDPVAYIYIGLKSTARSNTNICRGYAASLVRDPSDIMNDSAIELASICKTLEHIGFCLDPELAQYLKEENPATIHIHELAKEFSELKK